ncbi:MAG: triose-phosphate isomerase [Candidatus Korarchaeota archaeon]
MATIVLNFKNYPQSIGRKAVTLAKIAEKVAKDTGVEIIVAPNIVDLRAVASEVSIPVYAQHIDPHKLGAATGYVMPEAVKEAGAVGTLLNHSERRLLLEDLTEALQRARSVGLKVIICAGSPMSSGAAARLGPDAVAFEDPVLIGTGISVSTAKPEDVRRSVDAILTANPNVAPLCGAGVTTGDDVYAALKLGSKGVLLASGFVKATDPEAVLREMANAVLRYEQEK